MKGGLSDPVGDSGSGSGVGEGTAREKGTEEAGVGASRHSLFHLKHWLVATPLKL